MRKIPILFAILFISFITTSCGNNDPSFDNKDCTPVEGTDFLRCDMDLTTYFDTSITLTLYIESDTDSEEIITEVENIISLYHILSDKYNTYDDYVNVKTINDNPTQTHTLSDELYDMVKYTLDNQEDVNNLFNLALNPVLKVWHDYREECNYSPLFNSGTGECNIPTIQELNIASSFTDPSDITTNDTLQTITLLPGMSIDLGGMSKGYMSKVVVDYLDTQNIGSYLFNAGTSNVEIGGTHPTRESGKFLVAITNPSQTSSYYATVYLSDGESIVTSGDYQRYYVSDGEIYHHIIHPVTLMPERYTRSVSVVYSNPALADIYSTAIFLMTIEDGIEFVDSITGLEAIWFSTDNEVFFSENFETDYLNTLTE